MKKFILFFASLILASQLVFASPDEKEVEINYDSQKHYLVGLGGMLVFNLGLASWNRYMIGSAWAKTGWEEWNRFWERELAWDRDWYWTNYFLHPYQGSMYYMSARGANLNQVESFGVTVLGSLMWEYLCECNAPSKNDMIYTTIGSFCVGEMFYRLSQEANGTSKLLGAALNPERLFTEYLCGVKQQNTHNNIYAMNIGFDVGTMIAGTKVKTVSPYYEPQEIYPVFGMIQFDVDYNDPYTHDTNVPYSQFNLYVQGGMGKGSGTHGVCAYESVDEKIFYDIRIFSDAVLISRTCDWGENVDSSYGLTMIYDFNWDSYFMLSSLAPGFMFKQRFNGDQARIEWQSHIAGILCGTTDYFFYHRDIDLGEPCGRPESLLRSYNNTIGVQNILKFKYATESGHALDLMFRGYAMYDFYDQLQTDNEGTGWEFIGLLTASYELPVSKRVRLGVKNELYGKYATFEKKPNVYQLVETAKIFAKLVLK